MPEYIERETLMLEIEDSYRNNPHSDPKIRQMHNHEHRHFLVLASKQPTADVAEVKHGKWIEYQIPNIITCSECDWGTGVDEKSFKYCPHCGAKMDLK